MSNIEDRARTIFVEHLRVEPEKVTASATIQGDLGGDSLDEVQLVMALEEEFNVMIEDEALESIIRPSATQSN